MGIFGWKGKWFLDEEKIRLRFEKIMKIVYSKLNLKFYYLGSGSSLYFIEFLGKYHIYFDYDFNEPVYCNIQRCRKDMEFKILDETIRGV